MQRLYLLMGHNAFFIYEKENNKYSRQFIEGNSKYEYDLNHMDTDMERLLELLVERYNLENKTELDFTLIENEDSLRTQIIRKSMIGRYIDEAIYVGDLLIKVIKRLDRDKQLRIGEFGVNFDGVNYMQEGNHLVKGKFSLFGYPISEDKIMQYME